MSNFVAHFAIYADDLERAMTFYSDVFGWKFEPWGPPEYYKISTGDAEDPGVTEGGLSRRQEPAGSGINGFRCTVSVESIEDAVREIVDHGGELRSAVAEIPGVGKVVEFQDPEGNVVCAMEYAIDDYRSAQA